MTTSAKLPSTKPGLLIAWFSAILLAACLIIQVILPPVIGLADNGDFWRVSQDFGLQHLSEDRYARYFSYFNRLYLDEPASASPSGFFTSTKLFAGTAVGLRHLLDSHTLFDIRWLGSLNALAYWAGCTLILLSLRRLHWIGQMVLSLLAVIMLSDVSKIQFMNSFFSEPTAFISLVWIVGCSSLLVLEARRPLQHVGLLLGFVLAALLFVTSKPQFAPLGLLLGLWSFRLFSTGLPRRTGWILGGSSGLLIAAISIYVFYFATPEFLKRMTSFNLVFTNFLTESTKPTDDLRSLGIGDPTPFLPFIGHYHWEDQIQKILQAQPQLANTLNQIDHFDVLRYYLTHPRRLTSDFLQIASIALDPNVNGLGNFEKATGYPAGTKSTHFNLWSSLRQCFLPPSAFALITFLLINLAAAIVARLKLYHSLPSSLIPELHLFLLTGALAILLITFFGEGKTDAGKHLITFNLTCDLCFLFTIEYLVGGIMMYNSESNTRHLF